MDASSQRIYSLAFWLLCLSSLLFGQFSMMILSYLPIKGLCALLRSQQAFLVHLVVNKGLIIADTSGKLTDTVGRVPIMAFGSLVCFVCGFLYPILTTVAGFLFLRFIHGFSTGFKPTGTSAYIADIIPENRRGEALGLNGLVASIGMSAGPPLGSWLVEVFSLNALFYISSFIALGSIGILFNLK